MLKNACTSALPLVASRKQHFSIPEKPEMAKRETPRKKVVVHTSNPSTWRQKQGEVCESKTNLLWGSLPHLQHWPCRWTHTHRRLAFTQVLVTNPNPHTFEAGASPTEPSPQRLQIPL